MALFSPKARLYSLVPLSSQWPSIRTLLELDLIEFARARISDTAEALRLYLSYSKYIVPSTWLAESEYSDSETAETVSASTARSIETAAHPLKEQIMAAIIKN